MKPIVITGTDTDVGKTVVTAALAAAASGRGRSVVVAKPCQTGVSEHEPGDLAAVTALTGITTTVEVVRLPDPLAPETAALHAGLPIPTLDQLETGLEPVRGFDIALIEGAGGVLVRLGSDVTILDVATQLGADVVVVTAPRLGTLNVTELTVRAVENAGLRCVGTVIGSWPREPGLAEHTNLADLPRLAGVPLGGRIPAGAGGLTRAEFTSHAAGWFDRVWLTDLIGP